MKILQKILNVIAGILIVLVALILLSATDPGISRKIGDILGTIGNTVEHVKDVFGLDEDGETQESTEDDTDDGNQAETRNKTPIVELITAPEDGLSGDVINGNGGYVQPVDLPVEVPDGMAERTGFVPVQSVGQEVSETDPSLGYGETGDGLSFDSLFYPYYFMLNEDTQTLYRQIYANMNALHADFAPLLDGTSPSQLRNAFTAVCNDHPELFWVNTSYSYAFNDAGAVAAIGLSFNKTATDLDNAKQQFQDQAAYFLANTKNLETDYEKEILVHDALISFCSYDLNAEMNQSAYSSLVLGKTVCAGYAKGFQYLMQQLGIPVYYCTGYAGENHAWNIICLDGEYYNVDLTWDDTDPSTYNYFNGTDTDFGVDHARTDLSVNLPPCNGQTYRLLLASNSSSGVGSDVVPGDGTVAVDQTGTSDTKTDQGEAVHGSSSDGDDEDHGSGQAANTDVVVPDYSNTMISSVQDYYDAVKDVLLKSNSNPVTLTTLVKDTELYDQIYAFYTNGTYMNAFMKEVGQQKGARGVQFEVVPEELPDGSCRMNHTFTFSY